MKYKQTTTTQFKELEELIPYCSDFRFLATDKGGHLSETNGKLIRKWKWPHANVKITEPVSFQVREI